MYRISISKEGMLELLAEDNEVHELNRGNPREIVVYRKLYSQGEDGNYYLEEQQIKLADKRRAK